jgi:REP element-mobilizing transposase RayT
MPSFTLASKILEGTAPKPNNVLRQARFEPPCSALLHVHVIFVLTNNHQPLKPAHVQSIRCSFSETCRANGAELLQVRGFEDQLHLLIEYPSTLSIAELLTTLQSETLPAWQWNPEFFVGSCRRPDLTQQMKRFVEAVRTNTGDLE